MDARSGGIGLLGGTFDPIHLAHLRAATELREGQALDEVRLIPSARPPHKDGFRMASADDRLRMVQLGIAGHAGLRAWDVELGRSGPSYSVDTLRALRDEVGPDRRVVFGLGRDAFAELDTWKDYQAIFGLCDVVVLTRPPWPPTLDLHDIPVAAQGAFRYDPTSEGLLHASGHGVSLQRITALEISATTIRALVAAQRSIDFLVPLAVAAHIHEHGLYRAEGSPD